MRLLIVLVNYNGSGLTIDCLRSLRGELEALPGARIALCDNGSEPVEVDRLRQGIAELGIEDRVTLTPIYPNLGFTGGNNRVIRPELEGPYPPDVVFLLNNDTLVREGAIQALARFMEENPEIGLCGSRLEWPDGRSQHSQRGFLTPIGELERNARIGPISRLMRRWQISLPEYDAPHHCGWLAGASLAIRREVVESVGLLDEGLFTYFDDVDYCLRAARAGWPTWYVPQSKIVHLIGQTTGITNKTSSPKRRPAYWFQARRRYYLKNYGKLGAATADAMAVLGLLLHKARKAVTFQPDPDPPHFLWDHVRHSVFRTGFRLRPVPNPALQVAGAEPRPAAA